ncbi:MAG: hypothetical protein H7A37_01360 [Chlamydiales bacterium]|nr:hypothetical protein [Chlamydiia bacterium]MCP5506942.1 hypothetical protein [Chlamydiales bacterium]
MSEQVLNSQIARLESMNDILSTELDYIDNLMRVVGFSEGLATVKAAAEEIVKQGLHN